MSNEMTFDFSDVDFTKDETAVEEVAVADDAVDTEALDEMDDSREKEELEEAKRIKEEYLTVYDSMMFEDKFEKTYKLGKRYSCVLSTRSADNDMTITRQLDNMNFKTIHALQSMSALLTLSYSLVEFCGKDLRQLDNKDRYDYVKGMSSHMVELLSNHVVTFDTLVRNALSYGEENF